MLNLMLDTEDGFCLIDPHGELSLDLLARIPTHRWNDVIYLSHSTPIGLNVLENGSPLKANILLSAMEHVWRDSWGARMNYILYNTIRLLMDNPQKTFADIPRVLTDPRFTAKLLKKCQDPVIKRFWTHEFAQWPERQKQEAISPIQNKVGIILADPLIRDILSVRHSTIDLRRAMNERKIIVLNLSKGEWGEEPSHLLGALTVSFFVAYAMETTERPPFHLFIDEFHNFATQSFATALSELRKYHLHLYLAHQYLDQIPKELTAAVLGNVGTIAAFRTSATDAKILAPHLDIGANRLRDLPNHEYLLRALHNGTPNTVLNVASPYPPPPVHNRTDRLIRASFQRYGSTRTHSATR